MIEPEEKKKRGWVSLHMHTQPVLTTCMQDLHYKRMDRCLKANALEEEVDYAVTNFMIGDSLVFDFGETKAVQDHFRQIGGVKVRVAMVVCRLCPLQLRRL